MRRFDIMAVIAAIAAIALYSQQAQARRHQGSYGFVRYGNAYLYNGHGDRYFGNSAEDRQNRNGSYGHHRPGQNRTQLGYSEYNREPL